MGRTLPRKPRIRLARPSRRPPHSRRTHHPLRTQTRPQPPGRSPLCPNSLGKRSHPSPSLRLPPRIRQRHHHPRRQNSLPRRQRTRSRPPRRLSPRRRSRSRPNSPIAPNVHPAPPVADNERLCTRCSLAPVCLPEEARLARDRQGQPTRLFPADDERQIIHVLEPGTSVGRTGGQIKISRRNQPVETIPSQQIGQLVLHSFSQISTQALHFCADSGIGVHFISGGGRYVGSFDSRTGSIQRRIRQYAALTNPDRCLELARKLVLCRGQGQRKFLMRGSRGIKEGSEELKRAISQMQILLKQVPKVESLASLLGFEGNLAALYFGTLPYLIRAGAAPEMHFSHRNRRPPKDRFNALISFGYALLLKDIMNAILTVGLEPALGFYHQPRSQAAPLALDLIEIFRVPIVDMTVIASINRNQWDVQADFDIRGDRVWLSESGCRKFINLYEQRKQESWKHPVANYSLTYRRLFELEVRLLEKEWSGESGLFGQLIVR